MLSSLTIARYGRAVKFPWRNGRYFVGGDGGCGCLWAGELQLIQIPVKRKELHQFCAIKAFLSPRTMGSSFSGFEDAIISSNRQRTFTIALITSKLQPLGKNQQLKQHRTLHTCPISRLFSTSISLDQPETSQQGRRLPLQVAIVGAGPSGFYTAKYLKSSLLKQREKYHEKKTSLPHSSLFSIAATVPALAYIDIIDRLPTPFGLVRSGVAPDHPEVKNVQHDFEKLMEENSCETVNISYMGNVHVGGSISLEELRKLYDIVILSYGCEDDRKLGIPGENELEGIFAAREFVAWYNGHPDFNNLGPRISRALAPGGASGENGSAKVVVVGQGNVALDCARILAKGANGLVDTDIADHALQVLGEDGISKTTVIGRRGHVQGAFTIKELRELTKLKGEGYNVDFLVHNTELDMGMTEASQIELKDKGTGRPKVRIDKLLRQAATKAETDVELDDGVKERKQKVVELRFLLNPVEFLPRDDHNYDKEESTMRQVGKVLCERTRLEGEAGLQVAKGTDQMEVLDADMVLVSIGYRGIPLRGIHPSSFDERRGIVRNDRGRVLSQQLRASKTDDAYDKVVPEYGLYVSGWLKRGPSGIIGTNIADARETVGTVISDIQNGFIGDSFTRTGSLVGEEKYAGDIDKDKKDREKVGRNGVVTLLKGRGIRVIDWEGYRCIDSAESNPEQLRTPRQPRRKIVSSEQLIQVAFDEVKS